MAALFLNKGKNIITVKEFTMYVSLDLRWMQTKDADALMRALIEKGLMAKTGDYLKPAIDTATIDVPVAYRPSEELIATLKSNKPKLAAAKRSSDAPDLLPMLISQALNSGMEKGAFVSECNKISKKMDIDMEVATLMILREKGMNITHYISDVRAAVLSR